MADEQEIYKFIIQVENKEAIDKAAAAASLAEQKFEALFSTLGKGHAATRAAASSFIDVQKQLKNLQAASKDYTNTAMQVGYALDDLQYGFAGIANNIQPILAGIPKLAPMAPYLAAAAIAAYQLVEHWGQLAELLGQGKTRTEAEEMDELAKATKRTADEEERYQKLKQREKNDKEQLEKPKDVKEFERTVNEAFANGPAAEIEKGLDKHFGDRIRAMAESDPEFKDERKERDDLLNAARVKFGKDDVPQHVVDQAQKMSDEIYGQARRKFRTDLPSKPDTLKELQKAAEANPGDFGKKGAAFARDLALTPEQIEKDRKFAAADDQDMANEDDERKRDKEARKKAKKEQEKEDEHYRKEEEQNANRLAEFEEKNRIAERDDTEKRSAKESDLIAEYQDQRLKDAMKAPERRNSSVVGAADLANSIQGAVGGPDKVMQDQLKEQQKSNELLQKLVENRQGALNLAFQANGNLGVN